MIKEVELNVSINKCFDEELHQTLIASQLKLPKDKVFESVLIRRSLDARKKNIQYVLKFKVYIDEKAPASSFELLNKELNTEHKVIIVGSGPAGLYAAIELLEQGIKPIVLERGKDVKSRRKDLVKITRNQTVDPDSNYCFGEGGAGTYSDGKLYTRSKKRGNVERILKILVHFGADEAILIDAHPHIGTNKLPGIIEQMRQHILDSGGEFHFNTRVSDLLIDQNEITGVLDQNEKIIKGDAVILATGHSANDIYELLDKKNVKLEAKSFALGVRIEHPQQLIDQIQYDCDVRSEYLPPASYSLISKNDDRGAYSFCMCPGGIIAPCATSNEEIVTNGWSPSKRNNPFANAGIVVPIYPEDCSEFADFGALAGLKFRSSIEHKAWAKSSKTQEAPAQRLLDFMNNEKSKDLPECSYTPGITSVNLSDILPEFIIRSLKRSFRIWSKRMPRFMDKDAVLVGVESRTSSPIRIPRDPLSLEHTQIKRLYPSGEGAGYAGGIVSAAIDGVRCAQAITLKLNS